MAAWPYGTARWQHLRRAHLAIEPLCRGCAPLIVAANTVDHVRAISDGGEPFPPHDGLASYCMSCHSRKTARGSEAGSARTTRAIQPRKGCDADGNPLDPAHPWHGKSLGAAPARTAAPTNPQLVRFDRARDDG